MKALPKFEEMQGNPALIPDSLKRPLRSLKLFGESVQEGTPTPDAPVDIVSVENPVIRITGNNLFNIDAVKSIANVINNGDGTLTLLFVSNTTAKKIIPQNTKYVIDNIFFHNLLERKPNIEHISLKIILLFTL